MRYPNSEMISTYAGHAEGTHHHCEVLLRDDNTSRRDDASRRDDDATEKDVR